LSKRNLWGILFSVAMIIGVICLSSHLYSDDIALSDFQEVLANNAHVEFFDMPSNRSEIFPVIGREDGSLWRIARIEDDEIFFTTFPNVNEAAECYSASLERCKKDSLFLCECDVIYYRGDNKDTIQTLQQFSTTSLK